MNEFHLLQNGETLLPVDNRFLETMGEEIFLIDGKGTRGGVDYTAYVAERLQDLHKVRCNNSCAAEDSEFSCPSASEDEGQGMEVVENTRVPFNYASDGSLFSSSSFSSCGAAYMTFEGGGSVPTMGKHNIPREAPITSDTVEIKEMIQKPSSTTAEIVGLRRLLQDRKQEIMHTMIPLIHVIDSMATINAVNRDPKTITVRDSIQEPNRRDLMAIRMSLEELGYYDAAGQEKLLIKWIRGHNNDRLHDKVDRTAKRAAFRFSGRQLRFDEAGDLDFTVFYYEQAITGGVRNHVRRLQKLLHHKRWMDMRGQGKTLRMLEEHRVKPAKDESKTTAKYFTSYRCRELAGLQTSPYRLHRLGRGEDQTCQRCDTGAMCTYDHIQRSCPGVDNELGTLRHIQRTELNEVVRQSITGDPKLLIKGGNTGAEDLSAVKLFPLRSS